MVEVGTSYNKYLSPGAGAGAARVPVLGSMTLHLLASFDPVTGSYAAEFTLQLRWFDHRLSFNNLRAAPKINLIQPEQTEAIWFPHFVFDNTDTKKTSVIDTKSSVQVDKAGAGRLSGPQELENKLVYSGSDNSVVYQRYYSLLLDCQYTLHWYPFDTQVCHLDITPASELEDFVQFEVESFVYEGPMDLTEYTIKEIDMAAVEEKLRVAVSIQRKLLSLVLRTFIPTMILNIIGHMSNYYKESNFVGLMTLNVTVTLVLTTMFLSISTNLPPTAYIKMIDVWLLFNLLKPFIDIIVNTYIENLRDQSDAGAGSPKLAEVRLSTQRKPQQRRFVSQKNL